MNVVNWTSIFPPKPQQREQFITIIRLITPTQQTIYFDPASHFLWQEIVINGSSRWMCDSLPCRQDRGVVQELRSFLQDALVEP